MHLTAFIDDVAAADQRLAVTAADAPANVRAALGRALPATPVRVDDRPADGPATLGQFDDGAVGIALGGADPLVIDDGPALAAVRESSAAFDRLGVLDQTTLPIRSEPPALAEVAARSVAEVTKTGSDGTLHLGLDGEFDRLGGHEFRVRRYRPLDSSANTDAAAGELADASVAVYDGGGVDAHKVGVLAVPDGTDTVRGFLTSRPAIVDDLAGYLERTYRRPAAPSARGT